MNKIKKMFFIVIFSMVGISCMAEDRYVIISSSDTNVLTRWQWISSNESKQAKHLRWNLAKTKFIISWKGKVPPEAFHSTTNSITILTKQQVRDLIFNNPEWQKESDFE